jgi:S-adenosylmethionine:tRNA ribosyltransferase-isomerase
VTPARWPRPRPLDERLLVIDRARSAVEHRRVRDLPSFVRAGDLFVVNDAATLPASLRARTPSGPGEVRLAGPTERGTFRAVLFGAGDWRTATEHRPAPAPVAAGDRLELGDASSPVALAAVVERVSPISPRLVELRFDREDAALWSALYRLGRPVQYSYLDGPLELWHTQTAYAARPWAVEQPSAGRPLTLGLIAALEARGARLVTLTHAAGLSSTGDAALDAALPLPERFEIPRATADAVARARASGGRVIAVGTTVVRALEGAAALAKNGDGAALAASGETELKIGPGFRLRVVDGLYTGLHEPGTSHYALLGAFADSALLARASDEAEARGYLGHEFGDSCAIV